MILAGLASHSLAPISLSAVDWQHKGFVRIEVLPADDYGERCCWIKGDLLVR